MKLCWSSRSPFVRKVCICAHELGVLDRLELVRAVVKAEAPNAEMMEINPLSRIPTMVLEDGTVLYDSAVICEWLDATFGDGRLFPPPGPARWTALRRQTLADGMMEFGLLRSGEKRHELPSQTFLSAYICKVASALDALEREAPELGTGRIAIGEITIACALAQLDFRFSGDAWREGRPTLAEWFAAMSERTSIRATAFEDVR